jgi:hypothetical protein
MKEKMKQMKRRSLGPSVKPLASFGLLPLCCRRTLMLLRTTVAVVMLALAKFYPLLLPPLPLMRR